MTGNEATFCFALALALARAHVRAHSLHPPTHLLARPPPAFSLCVSVAVSLALFVCVKSREGARERGGGQRGRERERSPLRRNGRIKGADETHFLIALSSSSSLRPEARRAQLGAMEAQVAAEISRQRARLQAAGRRLDVLELALQVG
jgi:hypothetical protein